MSKMRFVAVAVAALAVASCSKQVAPAQPNPVDVAQGEAVPFEVPNGALFVARTSSASTIYRIQGTCQPLHSMNPSSVVFFWTLDAGVRAGYRLSKEEGCR